MLMSIGVLAQEENMGGDFEFYYNLGVKDAKYELSMESSNSEDEKDFWLDQMEFESRLKQENQKGYEVYVNGKSEVYLQHQMLLGEACESSAEFLKYMANYIRRGELSLNKEVVYYEKTKKTEPKQ